LLRWICTSNPFYVLSAGLFLVGLYISFGAQAEAVQTWALMSGLSGYTLLLAVTACLLVRFGNVWDDVRTVLLLVVLMFLATSVTFDEVLVLEPARGRACSLAGLLFALLVTEGLLRGIRLRMPAVFRIPCYLILALFFLYPVALGPLVREPRSETTLWSLFAFSSVAGLVFLTLLPAIRRGPDCVRHNGSPWPWPQYPWVLFGLLALAVPARAFLLCWSMHLVGAYNFGQFIFGFYFLIPFALAIAVLVLEMALVSESRAALVAALTAPVLFVVLALIGHRDDPTYLGFLGTFTDRLGCDPLYLAILFAVGFYAWAALRQAPAATEVLTGALVLLAVVGPYTWTTGAFVTPRPVPVLIAATLQFGLGLWRTSTVRCLLGAAGLVAVAALVLPGLPDYAPWIELILFHLGMLAVLTLGILFDDGLARFLRLLGAGLVLIACLAVLLVGVDRWSGLSPWLIVVYPLALATLLAGYGLLLRHRASLGVAAVVLACWLGVCGWWGYVSLRQLVAGLDYLALSLLLFTVALLISLAKSGFLTRRLAAPGERTGSS
jgi:hypothetical protein